MKLDDLKWKYLGIVSKQEVREEQEKTEEFLQLSGFNKELIDEYRSYINTYYNAEYYYGMTNFMCNISMFISILNLNHAPVHDIRFPVSLTLGLFSVVYGNYALKKKETARSTYEEIQEDFNLTFVKKR